ncbi:MAG: helix-turn-helix domain-containing protein [Actinobacteria bacterium]|nr:helix-turn-helix domain-containing protein [Actinomycetota bacterium]
MCHNVRRILRNKYIKININVWPISPMSITEISEKLGLYRSAIHRILDTL